MLSSTNQLLLNAIRAVNQLTIEVSTRLQTASSSLSVLVSQSLTSDQQNTAQANLGGMAPLVAMPSAAEVTIAGAASARIVITGTQAVSSLGAAANGLTREVRFASTLDLEHSANLTLITGTNIKTQPGDTAKFESLGGGAWRMVWYARADGSALIKSPWAVGADNTAFVVGRDYGIDTEQGPQSMSLPETARPGDEIAVSNVTKTWLTNAFTVTCPEAHRIEGVQQDLVCDFNIGGFTLKCVAVVDGVCFWRVLAYVPVNI